MLELKTMNPKAHEWLNKIPAKHWARSHFSGRAKSDLLLNNICGNNAEGSGSASRQVQQTEPAVGQDSSGRSGVGAVIGLSAATSEGGVGDPGGACLLDGREMSDGVPTQSSTAGGASEWSFL
ncbi:hypothetical protein Tco_0096269, partial [Tanacetum coccineum]